MTNARITAVFFSGTKSIPDASLKRRKIKSRAITLSAHVRMEARKLVSRMEGNDHR